MRPRWQYPRLADPAQRRMAETAATRGSCRAWAVKSVAVRPGPMALTVIPRLPNSAARIKVKWLMAALPIE